MQDEALMLWAVEVVIEILLVVILAVGICIAVIEARARRIARRKKPEETGQEEARLRERK